MKKVALALACVLGLNFGMLVLGNPIALAATSTPTPAWGAPIQIVPTGTYNNIVEGITCPTVIFCVALDASGNAYFYNGTSWSKPTQVDSIVNGNGNTFTGISCPSTTFCAAIDSAGYSVTYNGTSWSAPQLLTGTGTINSGTGEVSLMSVSCPTATFCAAVDYSGNAILSTNGTSWQAPLAIDNHFLTGVSCTSTTFCMAVDGQGNVITYNGSTWSTPQNVDPFTSSDIGDLNAVSCTSSTFCMAVDRSGYALSYNGSTWSAPVLIVPDNSIIASVTCSGTTLCVAGIDAATASSYVGDVVMFAPPYPYASATWGSPTHIDSTSQSSGDIGDASCTTTAFCVAGDGNGNVFLYASAVSPLTSATCPLAGNGTVGVAFSAGACTATGGTTPYTWSITGPSLPDGLTINSGTGAITGTPTPMSVGVYNFSIEVTDSSQPVQTKLVPDSITITAPTGGLTIPTFSPPAGTVGVGYAYTLTASGGKAPYTFLVSAGSLPAGLTLNSATGVVSGTPTTTGNSTFTVKVTDSSSPVETVTAGISIIISSAPSGPGYWMLDSRGDVYAFGSSATAYGQANNLGAPAAAMVATPNGGGYWVVSTTGVVDSFGNAGTYTLSGTANSSVVAIASTIDGKGYWVATASGQVLTAGDAGNFGSPAQSSLTLAKGIVSMTVTSDGQGYWLLGGDGGVFSYGDASFLGSSGQIIASKPAGGANSFVPNKPINGMVATAGGQGYWMVASDGGVFAFGNAGFLGSAGQISPAQAAGGSNAFIPTNPIVGMVPTSDGKGYWMVATDGGVFAFGDAGFVGSCPTQGSVCNGDPNPIIGFSPV